jgi:hypothetical protein
MMQPEAELLHIKVCRAVYICHLVTQTPQTIGSHRLFAGILQG